MLKLAFAMATHHRVAAVFFILAAESISAPHVLAQVADPATRQEALRRLNAVAQLATFRLEQETITDSKLVVTGNISAEVDSVWLHLEKDSQKWDSVLTVSPGEFKKAIQLRFGPGDYELSVNVHPAEAKPKDYFKNMFFIARNLDPRESTRLPSETVQSDDPEIIALAHEITAGKATELEKLEAVHDWVAKNIAYDVTGFKDQSYLKRTNSALETLHRKNGVCAGYSKLTAALLRAAGVGAKVVIGKVLRVRPERDGKTSFLKLVDGKEVYTTEGKPWIDGAQFDHGWNEALINGNWISLDTTADAGVVTGDLTLFIPQFSREYFNPIPSDFEQDHRKVSEEDS